MAGYVEDARTVPRWEAIRSPVRVASNSHNVAEQVRRREAIVYAGFYATLSCGFLDSSRISPAALVREPSRSPSDDCLRPTTLSELSAMRRTWQAIAEARAAVPIAKIEFE
jgi:hypothetical protein